MRWRRTRSLDIDFKPEFIRTSAPPALGEIMSRLSAGTDARLHRYEPAIFPKCSTARTDPEAAPELSVQTGGQHRCLRGGTGSDIGVTGKEPYGASIQQDIHNVWTDEFANVGLAMFFSARLIVLKSFRKTFGCIRIVFPDRAASPIGARARPSGAGSRRARYRADAANRTPQLCPDRRPRCRQGTGCPLPALEDVMRAASLLVA